MHSRIAQEFEDKATMIFFMPEKCIIFCRFRQIKSYLKRQASFLFKETGKCIMPLFFQNPLKPKPCKRSEMKNSIFRLMAAIAVVQTATFAAEDKTVAYGIAMKSKYRKLCK